MNIRKTLLGFAIAVVFVFFAGYGVEVFSPAPQHDTYCPRLWDLNESECLAQDGVWDGPVAEPVPKPGTCRNKADCFLGYEEARSFHDRVVFITMIIVGVAALVVGITVLEGAVGAGVAGGGVLALLYGTMRYWQHANNILKFILLGIALAILVWVGYKKVK